MARTELLTSGFTVILQGSVVTLLKILSLLELYMDRQGSWDLDKMQAFLVL